MQEKEYDLVRRAMKGNEPAFEALVRMYERQVFAYAYRLLSNHQDAEEVTQDVFVKLWRTLGSFRWESSFSTWILVITRNTATDLLRRRDEGTDPLWREGAEGEEYGVPIADASTDSNPEEAYLQKERVATVRRAIDALPSDFRDILCLRELQGLSYSEIAEVLSLEEGTVKSRINRARAALKKILKKWNFSL